MATHDLLEKGLDAVVVLNAHLDFSFFSGGDGPVDDGFDAFHATPRGGVLIADSPVEEKVRPPPDVVAPLLTDLPLLILLHVYPVDALLRFGRDLLLHRPP